MLGIFESIDVKTTMAIRLGLFWDPMPPWEDKFEVLFHQLSGRSWIKGM